ncbi:hypothetical protein NECAME_04486 [Necator americanus]|uniref:G-protein coupled receptors family 1 profile domain-containing protein n=1 Tax=Necator americanus TaxID=51031 RepID=W2SRG1_NECAM|nr:hypothetical protein NECAME_04486 [Necator americanus]ETN72309.1 hypothetical protein NECAME_04486 [Necator americanus]
MRDLFPLRRSSVDKYGWYGIDSILHFPCRYPLSLATFSIAWLLLVLFITLLLNILLVTAISISRSNFTSTFFKLLRLLSLLLMFHSIISILLKTLPSFFHISFLYQNNLSLCIDLFSRYLAILLIFILALNRFCVLVVSRLEELLFLGLRVIVLPCISVLIAAGLTVMVIKWCEMERTYVDWLGFVDSVKSPDLYVVRSTIIGHCFLLFPILSLLLHIVIFVWMKKSNAQTSKSPLVKKAERRMCVQVFLTALCEVVFIGSFTVLNFFVANKSDLYFITSFYNIISSVPELLIPAFILFSTKGMLDSFKRIFVKERSNVMKLVSTSTHTETS